MLSGTVPATPTYWAGEAGDSAFSPGTRLEPGTVLPGPTLAWYHPSVPSEEPIPFDYRVVFEDGDLIVVDKPHFLPTTSNGRIVRETPDPPARGLRGGFYCSAASLGPADVGLGAVLA